MPIEFTPRGIVPYYTADARTEVAAVFTDALGPDCVTNPESVNGNLIDGLALQLTNQNDSFLFISNQFDIRQASGFWLESLAWTLARVTRFPAVPTIVQCVCVGVSGLLIPQGSLVQDANGNIYESVADAIIPSSSEITITFQNQVPGPIAAPANSITTIYQSLPGWDSVNNPTDGVVGRAQENDNSLRVRTIASRGINSAGVFLSLYAAMAQISSDFIILENPLGISTIIQGVTLTAHSILVCSLGGTDAEIANALYTKRSAGCDMNGDQTYVLNTTFSSQFTAKFYRPTPVSALVTCTVRDNPNQIADVIDVAQAAIYASFQSQAKVGASVYASILSDAVIVAGVNEVLSVVLYFASDPMTPLEVLDITAIQQSTIAISDITVTVV